MVDITKVIDFDFLAHYSYVGDEHGLFSVIKFDAEEGQLLKSSNHLSAKFLR
ncbi:nucleotide-binding protein, partial [Trifolium medium]|nr:nucleotide-binding protein [Trifolium medium]